MQGLEQNVSHDITQLFQSQQNAPAAPGAADQEGAAAVRGYTPALQTKAAEEQIEASQSLKKTLEEKPKDTGGVGFFFGPPNSRTECSGGMIYRAGGGPVGSDTIPAMLSPGEMVINAASSRKFAAQLIAMNAGIQPAFRSEGGQTTNIGDINVSVTGGASGKQTARSIAAELRRELRRGLAVL